MKEYVNIETGEIMTEAELRRDFHKFAVENPETYDGMSFNRYIEQALSKNGSLREWKKWRVVVTAPMVMTVCGAEPEDAIYNAQMKLEGVGVCCSEIHLEMTEERR